MTAGMETNLMLVVATRVMLCRNIDTKVGLVNGAIETVPYVQATSPFSLTTSASPSASPLRDGNGPEPVQGHEELLRLPEAVSTHSGIRCHHPQMSGTVLGLRHC